MVNTSKLDIDVERFVETITGAAVGDGRVPDGLAGFEKKQAEKQLIVVAAVPKSGSTYLANTLSRVTGLRYFRLCEAYSTNEHDLYLPALCLMSKYGCVSQLHMKGTFHNAALIKTFGIKPIILIRRIYDAVISLKYDLREKEQEPGYGTGQSGYSFMWQDECTRNLNDVQLIDAIIDLAVPWYVNFYVSWYRLCEQGSVDAIWVTYEDLFSRNEESIKNILEFLGYRDIDEIDKSILLHKYKTFRSGRSDQGESELTEKQQERIRAYFSYYSGVDFSKYGI